MSTWQEIKDKKHVIFSDDRKTVEIFIGADELGNKYIEVPINLLVELLSKLGNENCVVCGKEIEY